MLREPAHGCAGWQIDAPLGKLSMRSDPYESGSMERQRYGTVDESAVVDMRVRSAGQHMAFDIAADRTIIFGRLRM